MRSLPMLPMFIYFTQYLTNFENVSCLNCEIIQQIKTEANIPSIISFVDKLYAPTFEMVNKKRDKMVSFIS